MNPLILVLFATLCLGIAEASSSKLLKRFSKLNSIGFMLIGSIFPILLAITYNFIFKVEYTPLTIRDIVLIFFVSCIYFFANKVYYQSYKTESASTSTVLMMFSIVVSTILGQLLFKEIITLQQWIGILIVLIAVLWINIGGFTKEHILNLFKPSKGKQYAIIGACLYGLGFGLTKLIVTDINPHYYQLIDNLIALPLFLIFSFNSAKEQIKVVLNPKVFISFIPIMLLYFLYNKLKYSAFSLNIQLPVADAVDNTVVFVILAMEFFIFKERDRDIKQKILISILAFIGILLISI